MSKTAPTLDIKIVPIGNSKGIRLPKNLLERYAIKDQVVLEQREEGILLRSKQDKRLSWEETYKEMAGEHKDWSDLDMTLDDGLKDEDGDCKK
jgi:antitoxin MazE